MADKKEKADKGSKQTEARAEAEKPGANKAPEASLADSLQSMLEQMKIQSEFVKGLDGRLQLVERQRHYHEENLHYIQLAAADAKAKKAPSGGGKTVKAEAGVLDKIRPQALAAAELSSTQKRKLRKAAAKERRNGEAGLAPGLSLQAEHVQREEDGLPDRADEWGDDGSDGRSDFGFGGAAEVKVDTAWSFAQADSYGGFARYAELKVLPHLRNARNKHEVEFLSGLLDKLCAENDLEPADTVALMLVKRLHALREFDRRGNAGYLDLLSDGDGGSFVKPEDARHIDGLVVQRQRLDRQAGRREAREPRAEATPRRGWVAAKQGGAARPAGQ